jgi:hypothetical protein
LELVYKGEFEQDPASDFVVDFVDKHNHNMEHLDNALGDIAVLRAEMAILAARGLLSGFVNGGLAGTPPSVEEENPLSISKMYVTPITYKDTLPVLSDGDSDPGLPSDPCRSSVNPYMVLYGGIDPPHLQFEDLDTSSDPEDPCPHGDDFADPNDQPVEDEGHNPDGGVY